MSFSAENTAPKAVLEALGSNFNNKTAEGYPGRRYHTGCQVTDEMEELPLGQAKALPGAGHANVQPHSGVNANLAVYGAVLNPGVEALVADSDAPYLGFPSVICGPRAIAQADTTCEFVGLQEVADAARLYLHAALQLLG